MNEGHSFRVLNRRKIASCSVFALALAACSENGAAPANPSRPSGDQELIGGDPALAEQFRATVGISDSCTAAKVGERLFLTAAHCVAVPRLAHGMQAPLHYPPNGGVQVAYLPSNQFQISWGLNATDTGSSGYFTVESTTIHPSWWGDCPLCTDPILQQHAADIAVIEIAETTPQIPQARVVLSSIPTGTQVVKVGYGCEERTNVDGCSVHLGPLKAANEAIIPASELGRYDSRLTDDDLQTVDASYLITPGHDQDQKSASLCLGDSGGPLYLAGSSELSIVGVNANYSFKPSDGLGGVSSADWHTRTANGSLNAVGDWLIGLGVKTVTSN
jgi:hypothetical protein